AFPAAASPATALPANSDKPNIIPIATLFIAHPYLSIVIIRIYECNFGTKKHHLSQMSSQSCPLKSRSTNKFATATT
ncbi:hypothetical protein JV197_03055, partial [Vibrio furnissii]